MAYAGPTLKAVLYQFGPVAGAALAVMALMASPQPAASVEGEVIWFDGLRDSAGPLGKLLSDNDGFWGDCVLTGVEYTYETPPTSPADIFREDTTRPGRRLLDGQVAGNWWVPVGVSGQPLVVVFDFQRQCRFAEIDLISARSKPLGLKVEVRAAESEPWTVVHDAPASADGARALRRIRPQGQPGGRYLRLTADGGGQTFLDEVLVWGDAHVSADAPERINPVAPPGPASIISAQSVRGIAKTGFSDQVFWDWQRAIGAAARLPVVWSQAPTWDSITHRPLLPSPEEIRHAVSLVMARNETENAALVLTNTSFVESREITVNLGRFNRSGGRSATARLTGMLRVAGAIPSRHYDVNLGPLFEADNLLGPSLMHKYVTNAQEIADFPRLKLPPGGSVLLWLSVRSDGARPGRYEAELSCTPGPPLRIEVEVLDVTLPRPFVWLQTWSGLTGMFPFEYANRMKREVAYKQSLGVTCWYGWPEAGTPAAIARQRGRALHMLWGLGDYGHRLYNGQIDPDKLTDDDRRAIRGMVEGHVKQAREHGLDYDDWFVELTDEPGESNSVAFGALARIIHEVDPRVNIYCNPAFWVGGEELFINDERIYTVLSPWYREHVNVSVPHTGLLRDRPRSYELFNHRRFVNAAYDVATQSAKSELRPQVEWYRRMAWDTFFRGWNGWGFYSYFAPRGNPWNDFDQAFTWTEDMPDYQMVYPGPRGPIATRQSEAVREGWEDYCLLTLLKQQGLQEQTNRLRTEYERGVAPEVLRLQALRLAAGGASAGAGG